MLFDWIFCYPNKKERWNWMNASSTEILIYAMTGISFNFFPLSPLVSLILISIEFASLKVVEWKHTHFFSCKAKPYFHIRETFIWNFFQNRTMQNRLTNLKKSWNSFIRINQISWRFEALSKPYKFEKHIPREKNHSQVITVENKNK